MQAKSYNKYDVILSNLFTDKMPQLKKEDSLNWRKGFEEYCNKVVYRIRYYKEKK